MPRVVHFDIPVDNTERASRFYSAVFGWTVQKWDGPEAYWLVTTGEDGQPGINGGLMQRCDPSASVVNTIDVPSVDEYVAKITEHGGKVVLPKMAVPGVGYLAHCQDTEGNTFGVIQFDMSAS
jgi:hypothetical protein